MFVALLLDMARSAEAACRRRDTVQLRAMAAAALRLREAVECANDVVRAESEDRSLPVLHPAFRDAADPVTGARPE